VAALQTDGMQRIFIYLSTFFEGATSLLVTGSNLDNDTSRTETFFRKYFSLFFQATSGRVL
jgi:hypothetical protein